MRKIILGATVVVLAVLGVANVAIADVQDRVTVCVVSNGQGTPDHEVTIPAQAADGPAFDGSCGVSYGGGFGGRVSAADTNEELADTR